MPQWQIVRLFLDRVPESGVANIHDGSFSACQRHNKLRKDTTYTQATVEMPRKSL
jgi:hypothetical protein